MSAAFAVGRQRVLGHLAALTFAALIAGSFSLGHLAAPHLTPAALNTARFVIASMVMLAVYFAVCRQLPALPKSVWRYAILGGLMATYLVLMFFALRISTPIATGAVFTLTPIMSAGFGWLFLRQTAGSIVLMSLLVAGCGSIWVIFRGDLDAILALRIGAGELIMFVGCAAHAAYAPLVRKLNRGEPVVYFTLFTVLSSMIWVMLVGGEDLMTTGWLSLPSIVWVAVVYLAVFATATTFFLVQYASVRLPASKVLSYGYLTPAFVIVIEGVIGHGWASASTFAGAAIIAGALLIMALAPDH